MSTLRWAPLWAPLILVLVGCATGPQGADSQIPLDQKLLPFLDEERRKPDGKGLLLFGVSEVGNPVCSVATVEIGQFVDGKFKAMARWAPYAYQPFSGGKLVRFEPHALPAGEYVLANVRCHKQHFNGPHAKFLVRAGEFVDIGVLTFERTDRRDFENVMGRVLLGVGRGTLRRTVGPSDAKHVQKLKEEAPALMTKLVRRPMTIPGPQEVGFTSRMTYH